MNIKKLIKDIIQNSRDPRDSVTILGPRLVEEILDAQWKMLVANHANRYAGDLSAHPSEITTPRPRFVRVGR